MKKLIVCVFAMGLNAACHQLDDDVQYFESGDAIDISEKRGAINEFNQNRKVGVLLTSHGDIDEMEEIEPYVRSAFLKNVGVPLPRFIREIVQDPAYWVAKDGIIEQYEIIGPTRYRANANLQAEAISSALMDRGLKANMYVGYNFMPPFVEDAVEDGPTGWSDRPHRLQ